MKELVEYDASVTPDAKCWVALSEFERLDLIEEYHHNLDDEFSLGEHSLDEDGFSAHCSIHMAIENQLAMGEKPVIEALARLQRQGLDRHDSLHAIGSVLAELIYDIVNNQQPEANKTYIRRVKKLTAKKWLKGRY